MPAALRRVMKQTKLNEIVQIESTKVNKILDNLPDIHNVFNSHEKMVQFKDKITIIAKLIEIVQKPHLFKVVIIEKVERLQFLASIAVRYLAQKPINKYFELNNLRKAEKVYVRIARYYRNKDAMNNFLEEDTQSLDYRNGLDEIEAIHTANFFNFAALLLMQNK